MTTKIKTREQYERALARAGELIELNPGSGSPVGDELDLLILLLKDYEERSTSFHLPTPIEAIKFRMEQQGLKQKDLIPFIGSKSKVSEVLSGKRKLSLQMIRDLTKGLGIPEKVLIQDYDGVSSEDEMDWTSFPSREMVKRGWLPELNKKQTIEIDAAFRDFFSVIGLQRAQEARFRMSKTIRSGKNLDKPALVAWTARIVNLAHKRGARHKFRLSRIDETFAKELIKLSTAEDGPLRAVDFLGEAGISLVIERHLTHTYLDGAAILLPNPVIGLTLRFDRLDNFWFTLLHELAHIHLHSEKGRREFFDDLEFHGSGEPEEWEADIWATEMLIPSHVWVSSAASRLPSVGAAEALAKQLNISPAIVAGRIHKEFKNHSLLSNLVGRNKLRQLFGV